MLRASMGATRVQRQDVTRDAIGCLAHYPLLLCSRCHPSCRSLAPPALDALRIARRHALKLSPVVHGLNIVCLWPQDRPFCIIREHELPCERLPLGEPSLQGRAVKRLQRRENSAGLETGPHIEHVQDM